MNHHNKEYLLQNIQIIEWHLTVKLGLQCSYELDGKSYYLLANPLRLTTLLSNVYLINHRRILSGSLQVQYLGTWMPFAWYVPMANYSSADLVLICAEHEETKAIESIPDGYMAARLKPLCYN
jgi:hypothetical protein